MMFCQGLSGLSSGRAGGEKTPKTFYDVLSGIIKPLHQGELGGKTPKTFYDVLSGIIRTYVRASWGGRLLKPFMMFCQGL